jgi:hypothetical protein
LCHNISFVGFDFHRRLALKFERQPASEPLQPTALYIVINNQAEQALRFSNSNKLLVCPLILVYTINRTRYWFENKTSVLSTMPGGKHHQ